MRPCTEGQCGIFILLDQFDGLQRDYSAILSKKKIKSKNQVKSKSNLMLTVIATTSLYLPIRQLVTLAGGSRRHLFRSRLRNSSRKAVNTNFFCIWFNPTGNRIRVSRFSCRRFTHSTTER